MTDSQAKTIKLSNGATITLAPLRAWDSVRFRAEFGRNLEALALKGAEAESAGLTAAELDEFQLRASFFLGWRSATAAGFEGSQEDFWDVVPLTDTNMVLQEMQSFFAPGSRSAS